MPSQLLRRYCCSCSIAELQKSEQTWALLLHSSPSNEPKLMPPVAAKGSHLEVAAEYWLWQVLQHTAQSQAYRSHRYHTKLHSNLLPAAQLTSGPHLLQ